MFLQLLPRSSTAERMNPYTSLWTGVSDGDGPREFHLVLLDNGRTQRAGRPDRAPGAELHPLLGVPERLPGVRAHRRPRLRLDLPGADRRDPDADAERTARAPARCPTPRACAAPATRSARSRSTSREVLVHLRQRGRRAAEPRGRARRGSTPERAGDAGDGPRVRQPPAVRGRAARRPPRPVAARRAAGRSSGCRARSAAGRRRATCRRCRGRASATGGAEQAR